MMLFNLYLEYGSRSKIKDKFREYAEVREGAIVIYHVDGKERQILINENSGKASEAELFSRMMGKKAGEEISYQSPLTGAEKTIIIKKIRDKYLDKALDVYKQAGDPAAGLPVECFKTDPSAPLDSLKKFLEETTQKNTEDGDARNEYYHWKESLSILCFLSKHSILWKMEILSRTRGINTPPKECYSWDGNMENKSFVLEHTSLYILHEIARLQQVEFPKLYISKCSIEIIKEYARIFEQNPSSFGSLISTLPSPLRSAPFIWNNDPVGF